MNNADFKSIYKKYRGFSIGIAKKYGVDASTAEDICQDTFVKIYRLGEELDTSDELKLRALIRVVTYNNVKDLFKKSYRQYEFSIDMNNEYHKSYDNLDELILGKEAHRNMIHLFEKLRKEDEMNYEIYVRIKIYGISPVSVAKQFDITVHNVNNRIYRTKNRLYNEYLKMSENPDKFT